jgi:membrane protein DedA with SNARE-associated domain
MQWFEAMVHWLVSFVDQLGVLGIFIMAFIESTFVPVPSEAVMIPAGYLIQQGKLPMIPVVVVSIVGTVLGAYFNYWLARYLGRGFFLKYGKYLLVPPHKLVKLEAFFAKHGAISTFIGRLIPGVRHYIPFPAGLALMDRRQFLIYTALGGGLWMIILLSLGYFLGANKESLLHYMVLIKAGLAILIVGLLVGYVWRHRRRLAKNL